MKIFDVIKYEGGNDVMVWKHPAEDFNTLSQLIVHESQQAILFKNGQALDRFEAGRHTLKTQNIPLLNKIANLPFDGTSPFHCEVYYVNTAVLLDLNWGVGNIDVLEPEFGLKITVGASGTFGFKVVDPRQLLIKVVGTEAMLSSEKFAKYFRNLVAMKARRYLYEIVMTFGYFAASMHQDELADSIKGALKDELADYGVQLVNFYVGNFGANEDDFSKLKDVRERKLEYNELGYNWVDEQIRDVMVSYAKNPGTANNIGSMAAQMPLAFSFGNMLAKKSEPFLDSMSFSSEPKAFKGMGGSTGSRDDKENSGGWKPPFSVVAGDSLESEKSISAAFGASNSGAPCPECGEPTAPGKSFCPNCGTQLKVSCANCGATLTPVMKFCPDCGTRR